MRHLVVIPAFNEELNIGRVLDSLLNQTVPIQCIVVVDDNSADDTTAIAMRYAENHNAIIYVNTNMHRKRAVGSKIIKAFNRGLSAVDPSTFDLISKFDADLHFDSNYIADIQRHFLSNEAFGLVGGICNVKNEQGEWQDEGLTNLDHVRGALKTYRAKAFKEMNGLIERMGWDSVDEFNLRLLGWRVLCDPKLMVEHHRETNTGVGWWRSSEKNGVLLNEMRYGFFLSFLACIKRSMVHSPFLLGGIVTFSFYLKSYFTQTEKIVSRELGRFIRQYRYTKLKEKLGLKP